MRFLLSYIFTFLLLTQSALAQNIQSLPSFIRAQSQTPILHEGGRVQPVYSQNGMVVTADKIASEVGREILAKGGNAVDAAIAVAFTMAVTMPRAGNLGGGGFMMVYDAKTKTTRAIDYREKAPIKATADMFLDRQGNVDEKVARFSHKSAGVPGTVRGLELAYKLYATQEWADLVDPAIYYASKGLTVSKSLSDSIKKKAEHLWKSFPARDVFFKGRSFYEAGDNLVQKDLARTLVEIATKGELLRMPLGTSLITSKKHQPETRHNNIMAKRYEYNTPTEA